MKGSIDINRLIAMLGMPLEKFDTVKFSDEDQYENPVITREMVDGVEEVYLEYFNIGLGFYIENRYLISIFIHGGEKSNKYSAYGYALPKSLDFFSSKDGITSMLGTPLKEGGGEDPFFGKIPCWIKYQFEDYSMHIEFNDDLTRIWMLTLERA